MHLPAREGRRGQHPSEVCAVGDIVTVWVLEVDEKKKRISLTMKKPQRAEPALTGPAAGGAAYAAPSVPAGRNPELANLLRAS